LLRPGTGRERSAFRSPTSISALP